MKQLVIVAAIAAIAGVAFARGGVVEKERPELNAKTRALIAAYRREPLDANKAALRAQVGANYDKVVARKRAKLEELKRTARDRSLVDEMQKIVNEMVSNREQRIDATMARFTDGRMKPGMREAEGDWKVVLGAKGGNVEIACTEVTNAEYAKFVAATGRRAPKYWPGGKMPDGREKHPVVWVSYNDALAYCAWLEKSDPAHRYRLPTEEEWELAAGHMPKDADFNSNVVVAREVMKNPERMVEFVHPKSVRKGDKVPLKKVLAVSPDGRVSGWVNHRDYTGFIYTDLFKKIDAAGGNTTPVDAYAKTLTACGAIDMWGNCWEWTSTEIVATNGAEKGRLVNAIKGGSWYANRNSCRTEYRGEGRAPRGAYNTVGFRVVREITAE